MLCLICKCLLFFAFLHLFSFIISCISILSYILCTFVTLRHCCNVNLLNFSQAEKHSVFYVHSLMEFSRLKSISKSKCFHCLTPRIPAADRTVETGKKTLLSAKRDQMYHLLHLCLMETDSNLLLVTLDDDCGALVQLRLYSLTLAIMFDKVASLLPSLTDAMDLQC